MIIKIKIPGKPIPKGRPRFTKRGFVYTPKTTKEYEKKIKLIAMESMQKKNMLKNAIAMIMMIYFEIPKSWTKKKKKMAMNGDLLHTSRPDLDNFKTILDACQEIVFKDDSQIIANYSCKKYAEKPYVEVIFIEIYNKSKLDIFFNINYINDLFI